MAKDKSAPLPRSDATVPTRLLERPKATLATYVLTVREGPDKGKSIRIDGSQASRLLVGTSAVCAFRLTDRQISRRHAAIDSTGAQLRLTDLRSTNGTLANGVAIVEAHLWGGETLRMGQTHIDVELAQAKTMIALSSATSFGRVLGASDAMRKLYPVFERATVNGAHALLEGEAGTGKELLAETLHERSLRSAYAFVVVDASATPAELAEAILFGEEDQGRDRVAPRRGAFEQADRGTLFLDEVSGLPRELQARLARVLETGELPPRADAPATRVDVRVIAATCKNLDEEIQEGRFDENLYTRLCAERIELPPLRSRAGDIELLARHFWARLAGDPSAPPAAFLADLARRDFPGNVRELRDAIVLGLARAEPATTLAHAAPEAGAGAYGDLVASVLALDLPLPRARQRMVSEFERLYVEHILSKHNGHIARAAAASGIALRYFQLLRARQRGKDET